MNIADYDFIDLGASTGGSIEFARLYLGGIKGIGVDLDPEKVRKMREAGHDCIQADITRIDLPPQCVRFVMMSHILEHLREHDDVYRVLRKSKELATDFLFIQGPYFDADKYLRNLGLKFYWSDWHGHTCHLRIDELDGFLRRLGLADRTLLVRNPIRDSDHPAIHPLASPHDQHDYDPKIHPPKHSIAFDRPIYREMICCVPLRPLDHWDKILTARKGAIVVSTGTDLYRDR